MAVLIARNVDDLLPHLKGKRLVLIDGRNGVGKTTLATALAVLLDATHIQMDRFLRTPLDTDTFDLPYPDQLDLRVLGDCVARTLLTGPVIMEGICILDVAGRLGLRHDAHVLASNVEPQNARHRTKDEWALQRMLLRPLGQLGVVDTELEHALLDDDASLTSLLTEAKERCWEDVVAQSLLRYFKKLRPHHQANMVYVPTR